MNSYTISTGSAPVETSLPIVYSSCVSLDGSFRGTIVTHHCLRQRFLLVAFLLGDSFGRVSCLFGLQDLRRLDLDPLLRRRGVSRWLLIIRERVGEGKAIRWAPFVHFGV